MKKSDIVVGAEYAYATSDWHYENGSARRARVVEVGVTGKNWRNRTITGSRIVEIDDDGTEHPATIASSREIREPWDAYAERWTEIRKRRIENDRLQALREDGRARNLLDLIPSLRHAGIEDTSSRVFNQRAFTLMQRHVPDLFEDAEDTRRFEAPLAGSIVDYIIKGADFKISADDLARAIR